MFNQKVTGGCKYARIERIVKELLIQNVPSYNKKKI